MRARQTITIPFAAIALACALFAAAPSFAQTPVFCAPPTATPKDKPDGDNSPQCDKECENCNASPCFAKSGVYTTGFSDLEIPTNGFPLSVERSYESWHAVDGPVGYGWTSNLTARIYYATYLVAAPNTYKNEAVVVMPDGEVYRYQENADGSFKTPSGRRDTLTRAADGTFTLKLHASNVRFVFAADGALLFLKDDYDNTLRITLDAARRVQRIDDDSGTGSSLTVTWNPAGRIGSVQDHTGRVVSYSYNTNGTLASATNAAGHITTYTYEQRRFAPLLSQIEDHWGRVITDVTWDSLDRVRTYSEDGETYTMTYEPALVQPRTLKSHSLGTQTIEYDLAGLVTYRGSGRTTYSSEGDVEIVTDARNRRTRFTYMTGGRIQTATVNEGSTPGVGDVSFHYAYHPVYTHKVASIEPKIANWGGVVYNGHWLGWKYTYYDVTDPTNGQLAGALKQVERMAYQHNTNTVLTDNCATTCLYSTFRYDARGRVTREWNRSDGQTSWVYDDAQKKVTVMRPSNGSGTVSTVYVFDDLGRTVSVTDPMKNVTSYEYDALDRIRKVTLPKPSLTSTLNFVTTIDYDQAGTNPALTYTHVTDANQRVTKVGYDQFDRLVESIDAAGNKTTYAYANGLLASTTDANGNVISYEYDATRQLKKTTHPDGLSESYTYYTDGLIASRTSRAGVTTTYNYDAFRRLVSETTGSQSRSYQYQGQKLESTIDNYSGVTETNSFTYDPKSFLPLTDGQGRRYNPLTGTMSSRGTITYTWEPYTDWLATYSVADGDSNRRPPITEYSYFADGSVNRMTWEHVPDGSFEFTYNANGDVTNIEFPNGQKRTYTYDNHGRTLTVDNSLGGTSLATFAYEYDKNQDTLQYNQLGLRTKVTARVPAWSTDNKTTRYSFDTNYQLVKARVTAGSTTTETGWAYDGIGNRISRTSFGSTANYTYVKNAAQQNTGRLASFGGTTATHDADGNMTRWGGITAAWDTRGRMSKMQDNFTFTYDGSDRRAAVDYLSTKYIYNGSDAVAISYKLNNGYYLADYVFAPGIDQPLARGDYFGVTYYSVDALGSVVLLSDPDGTPRNHYSYTPWGEVEEEDGPIVQPFAYTGRELAVLNYAQRGLYYYRARWMMPGLGRFMSEDPLADAVPRADASLIWRYPYTINDPVRYTDPAGLSPLGCDDLKKLAKNNNKACTGITNDMFVCVMLKESSGDPAVKNKQKGSTASGLMQITKATAKQAKCNFNKIFDPVENATCAANYMCWLKKNYGGSPWSVVGMYNQGPKYGKGPKADKYKDDINNCATCMMKNGCCDECNPNNKKQ